MIVPAALETEKFCCDSVIPYVMTLPLFLQTVEARQANKSSLLNRTSRSAQFIHQGSVIWQHFPFDGVMEWGVLCSVMTSGSREENLVPESVWLEDTSGHGRVELQNKKYIQIQSD